MAGCIAVLFWVSGVTSCWAELHQQLHSDAASPDHHCLATSMSDGCVDAVDPGMVLVVPAGLAPVLVVEIFGRFVPFRLPEPPGRAPPFAV